MFLCAVYLTVHLLIIRLKKQRLYPKLLVLFLIAELGCNMAYITTTYNTFLISLYSDYPLIASTIQRELKAETGYYRICFPAKNLYNVGQIYHAGSNSLFNSFVSSHQCTLNGIYGFPPGRTNSITANYPGTPFGLSLSSNHYIFLPGATTHLIEDLERYRYLGYLDGYYIFENTSSLSLGIYAPMEARTLNFYYLWQFYNDLASLYTNNDASLFIPQTLEYVENGNLSSDSFQFINAGESISLKDAESVYAARNDEEPSPIRLRLKYKPLMDGSAYLYTNEFIPLGKATTGVNIQKEVPFSLQPTLLTETPYIVTMNEAVFDEFIAEAHQNQLENISIINDTITGTTNYEKDGYTMLSLAWDRSWHAYIDGEEVEIEDPYGAFMMIKTPAGKHTLELKYIPYGMKIGKGITLGFWLLTLILFGTAYIRKRRKTASLS